MFYCASILKVVQFIAGYLWVWGMGPPLVLGGFGGAFLCLVLVGVGQFLNFKVYELLGRNGVYYGFILGKDVPWCRQWPFGPDGFLPEVPHPQYVGASLTLAGVAFAAGTFTGYSMFVFWSCLYLFTGLQEVSVYHRWYVAHISWLTTVLPCHRAARTTVCPRAICRLSFLTVTRRFMRRTTTQSASNGEEGVRERRSRQESRRGRKGRRRQNRTRAQKLSSGQLRLRTAFAVSFDRARVRRMLTAVARRPGGAGGSHGSRFGAASRDSQKAMWRIWRMAADGWRLARWREWRSGVLSTSLCLPRLPCVTFLFHLFSVVLNTFNDACAVGCAAVRDERPCCPLASWRSSCRPAICHLPSSIHPAFTLYRLYQGPRPPQR